MTLERWYFTIGGSILAMLVCYHVVTFRSLQEQFPNLHVLTAIVLPPPCGGGHLFGTYVYSIDARGTKHWQYACRNWDAGRWELY